MRILLLVALVLAGCAHQRPAPVAPASFRSPSIERCLRYWTAKSSQQATNHFYVYATEVDRGELSRAVVYWREGGRLLNYLEPRPGAEAEAWRLGPIVDRNTVPTDERIGGSNRVVTHRVWVRWMRECLSKGREYVVTLKEARTAYPPAVPARLRRNP
jgi:hypothetical protein